MQIDSVKGYKYVDKAGEVINEFHTDNVAPIFSMDYNGLVIINPADGIAEIKVSAEMFWSHFIEPNSLDAVADSYINKSETVLKILEVEKIKRLGWRTYFVKEYNSEEDREKVFNKFILNGNLKLEQALFVLNALDINFNIRIRKITKLLPSKSPGIMIDVDAFRIYKKTLEIEKIKNELFIDIKNGIRSEELLVAINNLLS